MSKIKTIKKNIFARYIIMVYLMLFAQYIFGIIMSNKSEGERDRFKKKTIFEHFL